MYLELELLQGNNSDFTINYDSKKKIAEPPLNLLFNPSLVSRKDVWDIDISKLLGMLLNIIHASGKKIFDYAELQLYLHL